MLVNFWRKLFKRNNSFDYTDLISKGAIILDVRSIEEFEEGHIAGSLHIPLGELPNRTDELDMNLPIIAVCRSGIRSGVARDMLIQSGFTSVYNGGGWIELNQNLPFRKTE